MTVLEAEAAAIIKIILSMTFTGSIISLLLFLLKPIIKDKLPKSFQYYMWFAVVTALMLPVSETIAIPVSNGLVMSMKSKYDIAQWISDTASEKHVNFVFTPQNENGQNIRQTAYIPSIAVVLCMLWLLGMMLVLGFQIICYVSYSRRLGRHNIIAGQQETELLNSLLVRKNTLRLYKNAMVTTPILIGFFRPAVILPDKKYEDRELRNILMHEMTHKKRYDIFVKWLLIFVGAVHWFNPLVNLVRREMNKACELACDESVIKRFDLREMQQYGDTLIAVAADSIRRMPLPINMFEDKKNLKERLGAIMEHKKFSKITVIAASVILTTIVCAILGFNTLYNPEDIHGYLSYGSSPMTQAEKDRYRKEVELREDILNYDKENIIMALVVLNREMTSAYVHVVGREENPDSEMLNGIKALASEKLELDIQNIDLGYTDYESWH